MLELRIASGAVTRCECVKPDRSCAPKITAAAVSRLSPEVSYNNLQPLNAVAKKAKKISAPIWGGNLTVIESLIGTFFLPKTSGTILFFEDIGERGYRLDRSFVHLEQAGIFKGIKAIVLGTFTGGDEPATPGKPVVNHCDWALDNFAAAMKIPVVSGLPIGHGDLQWPLPLGVAAQTEPRLSVERPKPRLGDPCFSLRVAIPHRGMRHEASRVGKSASGMPQTSTLSCPIAHASDGWSLE